MPIHEATLSLHLSLDVSSLHTTTLASLLDAKLLFQKEEASSIYKLEGPVEVKTKEGLDMLWIVWAALYLQIWACMI